MSSTRIRTDQSPTRAQLGLGNVDNTADLDKPVSTATEKAIKNISLTPGPQGPAGAQGPQGIQGPKGDPGALAEIPARLAEYTNDNQVSDWNDAQQTGFYCALGSAANAPEATYEWYLGIVVALDSYVRQTVYSTVSLANWQRYYDDSTGWSAWTQNASIAEAQDLATALTLSQPGDGVLFVVPEAAPSST